MLPPSCAICSDTSARQRPLREIDAAALAKDAERRGKIGLGEVVAFGHRGAAALAEYAARFAVGAERHRSGLQVARQRPRHRNAEPREPLGGSNGRLPAHLAMADMHQRDRAHAARHRDRNAADTARRRNGPEDERFAGTGLGIMHDADTRRAEARGGRQGDRHGEIHRNCGVGRVATGLQNVPADLGRAALVGRDGGEFDAAQQGAERRPVGRDSRRIGKILARRLTSATSREQKRAHQSQLAQLTARPGIHSLMVSRAARDPTHHHPLLCRAARAHAAS